MIDQDGTNIEGQEETQHPEQKEAEEQMQNPKRKLDKKALNKKKMGKGKLKMTEVMRGRNMNKPTHKHLRSRKS